MDDKHNEAETSVKPTTTEGFLQINTAINLFTAPGETFALIKQRPSKLFPILIVIVPTMLAMFWYFQILDYAWYIDDVLNSGGIAEEDIEAAREGMESMSQNTMMIFAMLGSGLSLIVVYLLQSAYLSLVAALRGDSLRFGHWFSLVAWCSLPYLLSVLGMVVNILMSPNGQLSAYALDPLTLTNLGLQTDNTSLQTIFSALNLTMLWSLVLTVMAYRQWLDSSLPGAIAVVSTPYVLIFGIWAYLVLT